MRDLHPQRPTVYLDQWVWIRLASAAQGRPREPGDVVALEAVRRAAQAGVAFPLSATHYIETSRIKDPRQRRDLAAVMADLRMRTLRGGNALLRHQMLTAMHETFGRPAFRSVPAEVLGLGVWWAMRGEPGHFRVHGPVDVLEGQKEKLGTWLRRANQYAETRVLAGPADEEVESLRTLGYRPESMEEVSASRLAWEAVYVDLLASDDPLSREELRVRVQTRELIHEHLDLFNELAAAYRIDPERDLREDPRYPGSRRTQMVAFVDRIVSLRIAVDLKVELFRNTSSAWSINDLHDVDAVSLAVPYCHVVVADRATADRLRRSGAPGRHGTLVTNRLGELLQALPETGAGGSTD